VKEPTEVAEFAADERFASHPSRAHPTVRAIFAVLRDGAEADARVVFRTLGERLQDEPMTERQSQLAAGLVEYRCQTGRTDAKGYDAWVRSQPRPHPFRSTGALRTALGPSWKEVRGRVFGEAFQDVGSGRLNLLGGHFTDDELLDAVRAWAAETDGPLSQPRFFEWTRQELGRDQPRFDNLPVTWSAYMRFGGWKATLSQLDLLVRRYKQPTPTKHVRMPVGVRADYSDEKLKATLQAAAASVGRHLSYYAYQRWADALISNAIEEGKLINIAHYSTYRRRWGTWPRALAAAGIIDEAELQARTRDDYYADDELIDILVEAIQTVGTEMTPKQYRQWAQTRRAHLARDGEPERIPSQPTMRVRLGGGDTATGGGDWEHAKARAIASRPAIKPPLTRPMLHPRSSKSPARGD